MPPNPQTLAARIVKGHRVASGLNGNPRFPGGTMRMQIPHFLALGLDLRYLYPGTLNVSIAPKRYRVVRPRYSFPALKWHPIEPAEDFSFFDARLVRPGHTPVEGFVYYPHPETKPEHFQSPDVLELLFPRVEGLEYGMVIALEVPAEQMLFE
ncbi:MAG: hypothetical protein JNN07_18470 [Verrucomicrobiales bacterium]|nr:hypothetical protein [Verrucomicrobiales bacterium]